MSNIVTYYQQGIICDVDSSLKNSLILDPSSQGVIFSIYVDQWNKKDFIYSFIFLRRAVVIRPDALLFFSLSFCFGKAGRLADARSAIKKAICLEPGCARYHDEFGKICLSENAFGEAADLFMRSLHISIDDYNVLDRIRFALFNLGKLGEAFAVSRSACFRLFQEKTKDKAWSESVRGEAIKIASHEPLFLKKPILDSEKTLDIYLKWMPSRTAKVFVTHQYDCFCQWLGGAFVYGTETLIASSSGEIVSNIDHRVWGYSINHLWGAVLGFADKIRKNEVEHCDCDVIIPSYQWKWIPNYYHFVVECLPVIIMFRDFLLGRRCKLLIDAKVPYIRDALENIGIPEDAVIQVDQTCRSFRSVCVVDRINRESYARPSAVKMVRTHLSKVLKIEQPAVKARRLYLSRNDARERRVVNESELMGHLRDFGFEMIQCSSFSFEEQVSMFSQSDFVISPHGASMANTMFMTSGTVVEIVSERSPNDTIWNLACASGLEYAGFLAETIPHDAGYDLQVDCGRFMEFIKPLL